MTDLLPPEAARVMSLAPVCDVMQLPPLPPAEAIGWFYPWIRRAFWITYSVWSLSRP